jgi:glycosyltransferase involved in cell wall biosynthesis
MRVLHFIDSEGLYGAEAVLLSLATAQQRLGHSPVIVSIGSPTSGEKPLEHEATRRGLIVHPVRMANGPNLQGALALVNLARDERADVLHCHGYKPNILLGFLPRRWRPAPLIATVHGYTHGTGLNRMRLYKWLDVRALRRFDRVVLVHSGMKTIRGLDGLDSHRVAVIENGLAERDGAPADMDSRLAAFCRGTVIGAIGRLSPEKGFDRLIAAFAALVEKGSPAKLVILGEGPERAMLERAVADKGLGERVLLPGFVDGPRHLQLFSVFVLSSLTEGLPISLLEAMRAGVPVVATKVGGVPSVLGDDGGLVVERDDVTGLARALDRVLTDPSLAAALVRAASLRVRGFSNERMVARYMDEYAVLVRHGADSGDFIERRTTASRR